MHVRSRFHYEMRRLRKLAKLYGVLPMRELFWKWQIRRLSRQIDALSKLADKLRGQGRMGV